VLLAGLLELDLLELAGEIHFDDVLAFAATAEPAAHDRAIATGNRPLAAGEGGRGRVPLPGGTELGLVVLRSRRAAHDFRERRGRIR
jgi:hypothetical protein